MHALACDVARAFTKLGIAIAASRPMMPTTIIISTSVKPNFRRFFFISIKVLFNRMIFATKKARLSPRLREILSAELFRRCGHGFFLFFIHQRRALAEAFAEVGEFRAAYLAVALDFNLVHAG